MKIYNTLTRKKEDFEPITSGHVRMYACGPTVYNYFHVGNGRTFLFFDVVRRYFEYRGFRVTYVQNITDIDDKIIEQSIRENVPFSEVAAKYIRAFVEDTAALGLRRPDHQPKATEYIDRMVALIKVLVDKGHAYEVQGDVYFDQESLPAYGEISGKRVEDLEVGARVEENTDKKHPADFTLWKKAKPGEPSWDSPWGQGRPGWHTECVVMSRDLLGDTFDIHGGAVDLIFPHHENENAQARAFDGKPLAKVWMHGGFLNMSGEKMSKSLGNFFTVRDVLAKFDPEALRMFFLSKHYRSPIDYSPELIAEASTALENLYDALKYVGWKEQKSAPTAWSTTVQEKVDVFNEAMDDDFNTAKALTALFDLARSAKNEKDFESALRNEMADALVYLGRVLGFFADPATKIGVSDSLAEQLVSLMIEYRKRMKAEKNYAMADQIRADLAALGIELLDTREGTIWKKK